MGAAARESLTLLQDILQIFHFSEIISGELFFPLTRILDLRAQLVEDAWVAN